MEPRQAGAGASPPCPPQSLSGCGWVQAGKGLPPCQQEATVSRCLQLSPAPGPLVSSSSVTSPHTQSRCSRSAGLGWWHAASAGWEILKAAGMERGEVQGGG